MSSSRAAETTLCEAVAGGMSSAQAVAVTRLVRANVMTGSMAEEALTIFAEALAQIVSSASEDETSSSAGARMTS